MDFIQFFLKVALPKVVIYQRNPKKFEEESQFTEIKKNMVKITRTLFKHREILTISYSGNVLQTSFSRVKKYINQYFPYTTLFHYRTANCKRNVLKNILLSVRIQIVDDILIDLACYISSMFIYLHFTIKTRKCITVC